MVSDYNAKLSHIPKAIEAYDSAVAQAKLVVCVGSHYVGSPLRYNEGMSPKPMEALLLESAWKAAFKACKVDVIGSAEDKKAFETSLMSLPEFTVDNIAASFGGFLKDSRFHILRGLAECFSTLDPAYKSHSRVKIGVKGLPKRIIITSVGSWGSHGYERLQDVIKAMRALRGLPMMEGREYEDFLWFGNEYEPAEWKADERYTSGSHVTKDGKFWQNTSYTTSGTFDLAGADNRGGWREITGKERGMTLKRYGNGNAHLIFDKTTLHEINVALAEFYGDVLPENDIDKPDKKQASTAVSKDLAFYWTPESAVHKIMGHLECQDGDCILEPSAGEGHIVEAIWSYARLKSEYKSPIVVKIAAVEVDPTRAAIAQRKGIPVQRKNFLEVAPKRMFDKVVMNPPFAGQHWRKHITHAMKFLKNDGERWGERGTMGCILPASAHVDGHLKEMGLAYTWYDLPHATFREAGTNVATGFAIMAAQ